MAPVRRAGREQYDERWQVSPRGPAGQRRRRGVYVGPVRITPSRVLVVIALVGSIAYLLFAITVVRDVSQIPMLVSGAVVLGLVFLGLAVAGGIETYRAGREGASARALLMAVLGGGSSIVAMGCFAGAIVLSLVVQTEGPR
jgi:RsiW-degrading membrane proteinase PrsW (M82 family)